MKYRKVKKTGDNLSVLGLGTMRLPVKKNKHSDINTKKSTAIIKHAIKRGVNYIDTSWFYHNQKAEKFLGEYILGTEYRDKVKIATKLPSFMLNSKNEYYETFYQQLKNLQVEKIDYYLLHGINEELWRKGWKLGLTEFMDDIKDRGLIDYIGFSFHGNIDEFKLIIDSYDWDFCQIQYNYLDDALIPGKEGLRYAYEKNVSVFVMEPLKGGLLTDSLPEAVSDVFNNAPIKRTPAEWALKWLWNQPEITMVLSGMNDIEHLKENIKTAKTAKTTNISSLSNEELNIISRAKQAFKDKIAVECTECGECESRCPQMINIIDTHKIVVRELEKDIDIMVPRVKKFLKTE